MDWIKKPLQWIAFFFYYLGKLIMSNLMIAYDVLTPGMRLKPGLVEIPVLVKRDHQLLMLSSLITMTPGTLCVDVSEDKQTMLIHNMYLENEESFLREMDKMQSKIQKLTKK